MNTSSFTHIPLDCFSVINFYTQSMERERERLSETGGPREHKCKAEQTQIRTHTYESTETFAL